MSLLTLTYFASLLCCDNLRTNLVVTDVWHRLSGSLVKVFADPILNLQIFMQTHQGRPDNFMFDI